MGRRQEAVAYYQNLYNPKARYNRITAFQKDLFFTKYRVLKRYEIGQVSSLGYLILQCI